MGHESLAQPIPGLGEELWKDPIMRSGRGNLPDYQVIMTKVRALMEDRDYMLKSGTAGYWLDPSPGAGTRSQELIAHVPGGLPTKAAKGKLQRALLEPTARPQRQRDEAPHLPQPAQRALYQPLEKEQPSRHRWPRKQPINPVIAPIRTEEEPWGHGRQQHNVCPHCKRDHGSSACHILTA